MNINIHASAAYVEAERRGLHADPTLLPSTSYTHYIVPMQTPGTQGDRSPLTLCSTALINAATLGSGPPARIVNLNVLGVACIATTHARPYGWLSGGQTRQAAEKAVR